MTVTRLGITAGVDHRQRRIRNGLVVLRQLLLLMMVVVVVDVVRRRGGELTRNGSMMATHRVRRGRRVAQHGGHWLWLQTAKTARRLLIK